MEILLNIQSLLQPISLELPAGENLEDDLLFHTLRSARESDPEYLSQGEWLLKDPRKADWKQVQTLCTQALTEQSKDLQLACWLVESLLYNQGLNGLQLGIEFMNEFITRFWFQFWPLLDNDGISVRRSKLLRLDSDLSQRLFVTPLLPQESMSLFHWKKVLAFEKKIKINPDARDELIQKEGDMTMVNFEKQVANFSSTDVSQQTYFIERIISDFKNLQTRYSSLCQDPESTLFTQTFHVLSDIFDYLQHIVQYSIQPISDKNYRPHDKVNFIPKEMEHRVVTTNQIISREHTIEQMISIAKWFRKMEPSSPVPFLMERAARWANMTIKEWLEEMLDDSSSIQEINKVLGQYK